MHNRKGGFQMTGNKSSSSDSSTDKKDRESYRIKRELSEFQPTTIQPQRQRPNLLNDKPSPCYYGLHNLGATCYLNAVLQTLFMTKQFREAVERSVPGKSTDFVESLKKVFQSLEIHDVTVGDQLLTNLGIKNKYEQQDAAEFFQKIVNLCNIPKIYHGRLRNSIKCKKNGHESGLECGSFVILPLAIESNEKYSVEDGWKKFFIPSDLDGDNQLYCDLCKEKTDAETVCEIESYPEVLTLQLKRFYFDYKYMMYMKNNCTVEIPDQLQHKEYTYELYAIIKHRGSLKCGHYYTIIKSFEDGNWYRFDDSQVTNVSHKMDSKKNTCQNAYVLMYTKGSGEKGHRQEGQSDSEAKGQGGADILVIPKSNGVVEKSSDNTSAESCTNTGRKACFKSGGKNKVEETDIKDVNTLIEGHSDVESRVYTSFKEDVNGYNRSSEESVCEGKSIIEHNSVGNAASKVGFTSSRRTPIIYIWEESTMCLKRCIDEV